MDSRCIWTFIITIFHFSLSDVVRSWHSPRALWTLNGTYRPTVNTRRKTGLSFIGWSFKLFWVYFLSWGASEMKFCAKIKWLSTYLQGFKALIPLYIVEVFLKFQLLMEIPGNNWLNKKIANWEYTHLIFTKKTIFMRLHG